jgi:hypothetical protein
MLYGRQDMTKCGVVFERQNELSTAIDLYVLKHIMPYAVLITGLLMSSDEMSLNQGISIFITHIEIEEDIRAELFGRKLPDDV